MRRIMQGYTADMPVTAQPFIEDALSLFYALRDERLRKKPSTAELPAWLYLLRQEFAEELAQDSPFGGAARPLAAAVEVGRLQKTLSALIKVQGDQADELPRILASWVNR